MKLLLDENLSPRLCEALADVFVGSVHVRQVGLKSADDPEVWAYASEHGFAVVTKDADFRQRSFLLGLPPKVRWVRLGNCSTRAVESLLRIARKRFRISWPMSRRPFLPSRNTISDHETPFVVVSTGRSMLQLEHHALKPPGLYMRAHPRQPSARHRPLHPQQGGGLLRL